MTVSQLRKTFAGPNNDSWIAALRPPQIPATLPKLCRPI